MCKSPPPLFFFPKQKWRKKNAPHLKNERKTGFPISYSEANSLYIMYNSITSIYIYIVVQFAVHQMSSTELKVYILQHYHSIVYKINNDEQLTSVAFLPVNQRLIHVFIFSNSLHHTAYMYVVYWANIYILQQFTSHRVHVCGVLG